MLEPCGPGGGSREGRTTVAATADRVVDDGREGQFFFPIRDAMNEMGAGLGLLAWLRSRGLVRVWEAVWTCIGGGVLEIYKESRPGGTPRLLDKEQTQSRRDMKSRVVRDPMGGTKVGSLTYFSSIYM